MTSTDPGCRRGSRCGPWRSVALSPALPGLHHLGGEAEEVVGLILGGKVQRKVADLALEGDEVGPGLLELDRRVQLLLPHQFVAHEAVDAAVVGALVRVLDQTQGARALLQPPCKERNEGDRGFDFRVRVVCLLYQPLPSSAVGWCPGAFVVNNWTTQVLSD